MGCKNSQLFLITLKVSICDAQATDSWLRSLSGLMFWPGHGSTINQIANYKPYIFFIIFAQILLFTSLHTIRSMRLPLLVIVFFISISIQAQSYDWPMWRCDYGRSAYTPEKLPDDLNLQWQVEYSSRIPVWDDPLNQNLMQFDRIFEPIVLGDKIFIGFNDQDKVAALDLNTGKELWHFYADGPVRLPLAGNKGNIYFTGDDGYCYCLNANTGSLVWKRFLAPAKNKLLGNKRLISMWPARGGVVIKDNVVYTAASIWPLMGTFFYALDAETGSVIWKNEGTSDNYILQPHNSPAFGDVAPQGSFAISGDKLLVSGGRSVPAAFNLKTGAQLYYHLAIGKGAGGGSFITSNDQIFFNHVRDRKVAMYRSDNGEMIKGKYSEYPVIENDMIYFSGNEISAFRLEKDNNLTSLWKNDTPATNDLIKAGNNLYAADNSNIYVVKINDGNPEKVKTIKTEKPVERLVASGGKLIAVTGDGSIMVYGEKPVENAVILKKSPVTLNASANKLTYLTGIKDGYAVVYGIQDIEQLKSLVCCTGLNIIALDRDTVRINSMREYFDNLGISANKMAFLEAEKGSYFLPKYFASLIIVNDPEYFEGFNKEIITGIYESVRPYGGKLWINGKKEFQQQLANVLKELDLYGIQTANHKDGIEITKPDALKGVGDWTHNYGNISNTLKSEDELAKAPLGILWFGGNSNLDVLPRHGHGPGEQVIDGKLIIEGVDCISARDVYTGRVLWKRVIEGLAEDNRMIYYDETYDPTVPLDLKYNQVHLPGANSRGTNFVVTKEYVYVIVKDKCHVIDINTGDIAIPFLTDDKYTRNLGYIGVYDKYLILGNNFSEFPVIPEETEKKTNPKFENFNVTASREILVLDRFSGKKIWSMPANLGFIHNSIIAADGKLFCIDRLPLNLEAKFLRRGDKLPGEFRLLYIDITSGKILHQESENIFGTWLGYSPEYKILLQATRPSRDMLKDEVVGKRIIVYNTDTKVVIWDKPVSYNNPPILHNDKIYFNGNSYSLLTGEILKEKDFITGEEVNWSYRREYGCGYVIASEYLLTFRSASAGFVNLETGEGTSNLGGFKASCSANLVVANGVLNAPDYTRTCQCAYQNQTSLAFINMPWMNYWSTTNYKWTGKTVKQLGLNLNAPGDRVSGNNTLWLDFPSVGGISPEVPVKLDTVGYYKIRKHPISIKSDETPWITASGIGGIRTMEITLSKEDPDQGRIYSVNLYFSELENKKPGERVFDISLQGKKVIENFDIVNEAGKADKEVVRTIKGVKAGKTLTLGLEPIKGTTFISGIELIEENISEANKK